MKYLRIIEKFKNDIVARLSELSEKKVGQINFHFATQKLKTLITETKNFQDFIKEKKFVNLRHEYISHKKLPATWEEHKAPYRISNLTILKGIAKALILMKGIDQVYLGIRSTFLWYEMRKKRYDFSMPFSGYTLLPYLRLPEKTRIYIAKIEEEQGKEIWEDESIKKDNHLIRIKVYKELGLVKLGDQLIALPEYPVNSIKNIEFQK